MINASLDWEKMKYSDQKFTLIFISTVSTEMFAYNIWLIQLLSLVLHAPTHWCQWTCTRRKNVLGNGYPLYSTHACTHKIHLHTHLTCTNPANCRTTFHLSLFLCLLLLSLQKKEWPMTRLGIRRCRNNWWSSCSGWVHNSEQHHLWEKVAQQLAWVQWSHSQFS